MAKGHERLEKKVDELASLLKDIVSHPVESPHLQLIASEVINGKIAFLKNLLSAETQSQSTETDHLHDISQYLNELESLYKYWDTFKTSPETPMDDDNKVDTASTCSSPESCLNNDEVATEDGGGAVGSGGGGEDLDAHLHKDMGIVFEDVNQERRTVETVKAKGCKVKEREREERRVWLSRNKVCAVMSGVMMLIVVVVHVVMASFCGSCCNGSEVESFLTPT